MTFSYGAENTVSTVNGSGLFHDALKRLVYVAATPGTRFGYVGDDLTNELDGSGVLLRRYVFGPGRDEPIVWYEGSGTGDKRYLDSDERGSVTRITKQDGSTLAIDSYDEYGIPGAGNQGRFQYTGQAWIAQLGLYYYKNRLYSPTFGRFMQPDPIGDADGPNIYNYVHSDPVNATDPLGLGACRADGSPIGNFNGLGGYLSTSYTITCDGGSGNRGTGGIGAGPGGGRRNDRDGSGNQAKEKSQNKIGIPPCSAVQKALQKTGRLLSDVGSDVSNGGALAATIGIGEATLGAATGNPGLAYLGVITIANGGNGITTGGLLSYFGAYLQAAGGAPKSGVTSYVNNALTSRIPIPAVKTFVKDGLKAAEESLPSENICQ